MPVLSWIKEVRIVRDYFPLGAWQGIPAMRRSTQGRNWKRAVYVVVTSITLYITMPTATTR